MHAASTLLTAMAVLSFLFAVDHCNVFAQLPHSQPTIYIPPGASNPGTSRSFDPPVANFGLISGPVTVRWINQDNAYHTVTSVTNSFTSQMIPPNGQFDHTFYDSGYYDYYCTLHPYMTGAVSIG